MQALTVRRQVSFTPDEYASLKPLARRWGGFSQFARFVLVTYAESFRKGDRHVVDQPVLLSTEKR